MIRTESFMIDSTHAAWDQLCTLSNLATRVRNQALYRMRKSLKETGKWNETTVRKSMRADEYEFYVAMPQKLAREASRHAGMEMKSWIAALKAGHPTNQPGFKKHTARTTLYFSAHDQLSFVGLREGYIKVGGVDAPLARIPRCGKVKEVRVIPLRRAFRVEVVHEGRGPRRSPGSRVAGIDLGVNNLAAVLVDEPGVKPLLVCGRQVKSVNQGYNRRVAKAQAALPGRRHSSARIAAMTEKRNRQVKELIHAASRTIVDYLVENQVGTVYVGWNEGFKSGPSNLGSRFNQRFRQLPLRVLLDQVTYKASAAGIAVVETEESYTSKTSLLDGEVPQRQDVYVGQRVKRGLYRAADGRVVNADVNGAGQIVRKCKPDAFQWLVDGVEATEVPVPVRVRAGGWPCVTEVAQKEASRVVS